MLFRYFFFFCSLLLVAEAVLIDPDKGKLIEDIVRSRGNFDLESHSVVTEDGYILTIHRLVDVGRSEKKEDDISEKSKKKPVILQHGVTGSSADYLVSSPFLYGDEASNDPKNCSNGSAHTTGDNLAFALHLTQRYDVWLGNSRGNRYSTGHTKYDRDIDTEYWKFSFVEMAQYDHPAVIDYILNVTKSHSVGYVGFSQGTTSMFSLLSLKPAYASKVKPVVAMAPVYTVGSVKSIIRYIPWWAIKILETHIGPFPSWFVNEFSKDFCTNLVVKQYFCQSFIFLVSGFNYHNANTSRLPVYYDFMPSSFASWEIAHWAQLLSSRRFSHFDFGSSEENFKHYGTSEPPEIDLLRIPANTTIALMRSLNDFLSDVPDQRRLIIKLKRAHVNLIDYVVPNVEWTHLDFIIGMGAGQIVYDKVIQVLDEYTE